MKFESKEDLAAHCRIPGLKDLEIDHCPVDVTSIPDFPCTLIEARIIYCLGLRRLPRLTGSLQRLTVFACPNVASLPVLDGSALTYLFIHDFPNVTSLPVLPNGLRELKVSSCPGLKRLPKLPATLTHLTVDTCDGLTELPLCRAT